MTEIGGLESDALFLHFAIEGLHKSDLRRLQDQKIIDVQYLECFIIDISRLPIARKK
jgi:hypothetical protein